MKKIPKKLTIDPNKIKTRDPAQLHIIKGFTKAGIHIDRKKEVNKRACRKKPDKD